MDPTSYEEHDWIYVHPLYSTDNGLKFDRYYPLVKPIINKLKTKKLFDIRADLLVPTPHHITFIMSFILIERFRIEWHFFMQQLLMFLLYLRTLLE